MTQQYLVLQNNYEAVEIGLIRDSTLIAEQRIAKTEASKFLVPSLNTILKGNGIQLADISAIIANNGPGPFTTLRVVIATVNGMSFATGIPIVGIDALDAALFQWRSAEYPTTAILFNAFGNDVYAIIEDDKKTVFKGVIAIDQLIEMMQQTGKTIRFLGNGTSLHKKLITKQLGIKAVIPKDIPAYCSLKAVATLGLTKWNKNHLGVNQLEPYYLKKHPAQK